MKPWEKYGLPEPKSEASGGPLSLRDYEVYSGLVVPQLPVVVRLDGWNFRKLTQKLKKPFDAGFKNAMVKTAMCLMKQFHSKMAYLFSDEINLLFDKTPGFERVEKIDSIFAGLASSTFGEIFGCRAVFDCRVIPIPKKKVSAYFKWRKAECRRNFANAWSYYLLRRKGLSGRSVQKKLSGLKISALVELCVRNGVDLKKRPKWEREGITLRWEPYGKRGYDPIKKKKVLVERRRIVVV